MSKMDKQLKELKKLSVEAKKAADDFLYHGGSFAKSEQAMKKYFDFAKELTEQWSY